MNLFSGGPIRLICFVSALLPLIHPVPAAEAANEIELITMTEARYPPNPIEIRGPVPGPTVQVISPPSDVAQISPIRLILRFNAYGGTVVDKDSVRLIYEKDPLVELTWRVSAYIEPTGINIENAKVPPGTHIILVRLKDSSGRVGETHFQFTIAR
jgi:hypothetical protein